MFAQNHFCHAVFRLLLVAAGLLVYGPQLSAQTPYRICSYNVLDGPVTPDEDEDFRVVVRAIGNLTILGTAQPIDILGFQEGPENSAEYDGIEAIFESEFGGNYESSIATADFFGCRTGFIYNIDRLQIINAATLASGFTHNVRRVRFRPLAGTAADDFHVYSIHLKAGSTAADANERAAEASLLRTDSVNLPGNAPIIFLGDLNLQGSLETAWQTLTAPGQNASAIDTLNTPFGFRNNIRWNDNLAFQPFHSQNPVNNMDDRFDVILINQPLTDGAGLEYVTGSATVLGNNGSHTIGQGINTGNGTIGFGAELVAFSDHAPVVCDFELFDQPFQTKTTLATDAVLSRTVRTSGPVTGAAGNESLLVEGTANGTFASFGVIDFDLTDLMGTLPPAMGVRRIALQIAQSNAGFSANGPISLYVASPIAAAIPINSSIVYQSGQNELQCVPAVLSTGAQRVATFAAVHRNSSGGVLPNGTMDSLSLFGDSMEQALINALNSAGLLRLLVVPDEAATTATFAGYTSNLGAINLSFDVSTDAGGSDVFPNSISVVTGFQTSGNLQSLNASDDNRVRFLSALQSPAGNPLVQVVCGGNLGVATATSLTVTLESRAVTPNLLQSVELFNFSTETWEGIDSSAAAQADQTIVRLTTGNPIRFIGPGQLILTRLSWNATGPVVQFPWASDIDLLKWTVVE